MLLRKSFPDATHFTAGNARDVTMFLCHLFDEPGAEGHLTEDTALTP